MHVVIDENFLQKLRVIFSDSVSIYMQERPILYFWGEYVVSADDGGFDKGVHFPIKH